jgi:type IX secretion system substrate protein
LNKKILIVLFSCISCYAEWQESSFGISFESVPALVSSGNFLYAGTPYNGIFRSQDNGSSWYLVVAGTYINAFAAGGNTVLAGGDGVYISLNNGVNWIHSSMQNQSIRSLAVNGNNFFAGTIVDGIYLSTDNGLNWDQSSLKDKTIFALLVSGNNLYAGTENYGVYLSSDNGSTWVKTALNNRSVTSLSVSGNSIFAGTFSNTASGIYESTNNGDSWIQTSLNNENIYSLITIGSYIFAGTESTGVYVSLDNGVSWTQHNEGMGNLTIMSFCTANNYIFAGIGVHGGVRSIYRRLVSEFVGIKPVSGEIPGQFSLLQNYPNPFNPSTKIKFNIPKSGNAKLTVYDNQGKEMTKLLNAELNPGIYEIEFNAINFPSGVYFYKLIVGENTNNGGYSETKKMVLVK